MFPRAGTAFADVHAALADAVVGDGAALDARLQEMPDLETKGRLPSGPVVPALSGAFAALLRQDFSAAISAIEPVLGEHERIGGSRAQPDLVEFTLLQAYAHAGRLDDHHRALGQRRRGPPVIPIADLPIAH
jgi:hypothetical protein